LKIKEERNKSTITAGVNKIDENLLTLKVEKPVSKTPILKAGDSLQI